MNHKYKSLTLNSWKKQKNFIKNKIKMIWISDPIFQQHQPLVC